MTRVLSVPGSLERRILAARGCAGILLLLSSPTALLAQSTEVQPGLDIKIVCAAAGERVPRQDDSGARSGTDRFRGRQIQYMVGPRRFSALAPTVAQVGKLVAEPRPMLVRVHPDPGVAVADVATMLAGLATQGIDDVVVAWRPSEVWTLRGDERTKVFDLPAVEMRLGLRTVAPDATGVRIPPTVDGEFEGAHGPAAVVDIGQNGECTHGDTVFFDPRRDRDDDASGEDLTALLAAARANALKAAQADVPASGRPTVRLTLHADRWTEMKWLRRLLTCAVADEHTDWRCELAVIAEAVEATRWSAGGGDG